jgi:hypothetical protein
MASASIFCANALEVDPGASAEQRRFEIVAGPVHAEHGIVASAIARHCTCSKSAAKSLLLVEMLVRPDGVRDHAAALREPAPPLVLLFLAVFAIFTGNYQLPRSVSPAESLEFEPRGAQNKSR